VTAPGIVFEAVVALAEMKDLLVDGSETNYTFTMKGIDLTKEFMGRCSSERQ
jgi:hypothetical protein